MFVFDTLRLSLLFTTNQGKSHIQALLGRRILCAPCCQCPSCPVSLLLVWLCVQQHHWNSHCTNNSSFSSNFCSSNSSNSSSCSKCSNSRSCCSKNSSTRRLKTRSWAWWMDQHRWQVTEWLRLSLGTLVFWTCWYVDVNSKQICGLVDMWTMITVGFIVTTANCPAADVHSPNLTLPLLLYWTPDIVTPCWPGG